MNIELGKFKRAILLNSKIKFGLPKMVYSLTNTPQFGFRARNIIFALEYMRQNSRRGFSGGIKQIAEFGVAEGEGFRQLCILVEHFCALHGLAKPELYGFDSFEGMHKSNDPSDKGTWDVGDYKGNYEALTDFIQKGKLTNCQLVKGYFSESLAKLPQTFNPDLILVDCDYYTSTRDIFEHLKDRLNSGSVVYFDDLGTNFYNKNLGEERVIHEVNNGKFGEEFYLHQIWDRCYVWSNSNKPVQKKSSSIKSIPLKKDLSLSSFY